MSVYYPFVWCKVYPIIVWKCLYPSMLPLGGGPYQMLGYTHLGVKSRCNLFIQYVDVCMHQSWCLI